MFRRLSLLFVAALLCTSLYSQQTNDDIIIIDNPIEKSFSFAIGPKVGAGLARGATSSYGFGIDNGLSYHAGFQGALHFGHRYESSPGGTGLLGVSVEVLYECRMPTIDAQPVSMRCVEVPVMLDYYPIASLATEFVLEAGMTFVKMLKCSPDIIQHDNIVLHTGQLSSMDMMASVGASYQTPFNLAVDLRYNLGLLPLAGNFDSTISILTVSAVYFFDL